MVEKQPSYSVECGMHQNERIKLNLDFLTLPEVSRCYNARTIKIIEKYIARQNNLLDNNQPAATCCFIPLFKSKKSDESAIENLTLQILKHPSRYMLKQNINDSRSKIQLPIRTRHLEQSRLDGLKEQYYLKLHDNKDFLGLFQNLNWINDQNYIYGLLPQTYAQVVYLLQRYEAALSAKALDEIITISKQVACLVDGMDYSRRHYVAPKTTLVLVNTA